MRSRFCRTPPCGGSQPIGQSDAPAGLQAHRLVAFKNSPAARPVYGPSVRDGSSAPCRAKTKERGSPVCSTRDQVHLSDELGCRTAGCERGFYAKAVATRLQKARNRSAADTVRDRCRKTGIRPQCVCRQRGCAWGVATAGQSSFSQLRLSENRRKQFSSSTTRHVACNVVVNAFQQYERLVSLATANLERR
jgi:hypothetical protein